MGISSAYTRATNFVRAARTTQLARTQMRYQAKAGMMAAADMWPRHRQAQREMSPTIYRVARNLSEPLH